MMAQDLRNSWFDFLVSPNGDMLSGLSGESSGVSNFDRNNVALLFVAN